MHIICVSGGTCILYVCQGAGVYYMCVRGQVHIICVSGGRCILYVCVLACVCVCVCSDK